MTATPCTTCGRIVNGDSRRGLCVACYSVVWRKQHREGTWKSLPPRGPARLPSVGPLVCSVCDWRVSRLRRGMCQACYEQLRYREHKAGTWIPRQRGRAAAVKVVHERRVCYDNAECERIGAAALEYEPTRQAIMRALEVGT